MQAMLQQCYMVSRKKIYLKHCGFLINTAHRTLRIGYPRRYSLKTHDLLALARLIKINLSEEYELSMSILSDVTTWSGRYPCSLKGDEGAIARFPLANEHADTLFKKYSRPFTSIS